MNDIVLWMILAIAILLAVGMILFALLKLNRKKRLKKEKEEFLTESLIKVEEITRSSIPDNAKLIEIKDKKILGGISVIAPSFVNISKGFSALNNKGIYAYKAVIPMGATLNQTSTIINSSPNAVSIAGGQVGFIPVAMQAGVQSLNAAAGVMAVGSIIVGQYYMNQIHANLKELNRGITALLSFQNAEYRSKVMSLVSHIKNLTSFQMENLNDEELRSSVLMELTTLENECTELLGQAGEAIRNIVSSNENEFSRYEKDIEEIEKWTSYQNVLFELLGTMAELKFVFHLGKMSREQCNALSETYEDQIEEIRNLLSAWHDRHVKVFNLDLSAKRRERKGADKIVHFIPAIFDKNKKYKGIDDKTIDLICSQMDRETTKKKAEGNLFDKDVELIAKEGKIYYLARED